MAITLTNSNLHHLQSGNKYAAALRVRVQHFDQHTEFTLGIDLSLFEAIHDHPMGYKTGGF